MKTKSKSARRWQGVTVSVITVAAVCLAGCQTTGYEKGDAAAWNSRTAAMEVQTESRELEATLASLNELVTQPAADAKPQFLKFSAALDRLNAAAAQAGGSVNRMWQKRSAYLETWDKEIATINDEEIRRVSQGRKTEVSNQFDSTARRYDDGQKQLQPLIRYLNDIRKALSTDLTREGLAAAQASVDRANEKAREVQNVLAQSAAELDTLSARTASFRVRDTK